MGFYLLYDHLDHLFDELAFAQRTHRNVQAYVKLHEQRQEQGDSMTIATSIVVTWMRPGEGIIHAARMPVDSTPSRSTIRAWSARSRSSTSVRATRARW